ncbi:B-zip transcription factor [Aspergillus sp. HF37]|nr:B-zip transcription factor [Aspergillus sp. HF37]
MDPDEEAPDCKKRELRAGGRKVTTLSARQLERKRANDREAQRTIRQRTKEHIEFLEHQVDDLKVKRDQFDDVVRRNGALEDELTQLRQQLAMLADRQPYANHASMYESSSAEYPNRVEPYTLESQFPARQMAQGAASMPVSPNRAGFDIHGGGLDPAGHSFSQPYEPGNPQPRHDELLPWDMQQALFYDQGQRSVSVPAVPSERSPDGYTIIPSPQQPPHTMSEQQMSDQYNYAWVSQA